MQLEVVLVAEPRQVIERVPSSLRAPANVVQLGRPRTSAEALSSLKVKLSQKLAVALALSGLPAWGGQVALSSRLCAACLAQ